MSKWLSQKTKGSSVKTVLLTASCTESPYGTRHNPSRAKETLKLDYPSQNDPLCSQQLNSYILKFKSVFSIYSSQISILSWPFFYPPVMLCTSTTSHCFAGLEVPCETLKGRWINFRLLTFLCFPSFYTQHMLHCRCFRMTGFQRFSIFPQTVSPSLLQVA